MASRLSEESLRAAYDAGHQAFSLKTTNAKDLLAETPLDLDAMLDSPKAKQLIQALSPQPLYHALMQRGLEDSLEVLRVLSQSQLVKMFDYDAWTYDHLNPVKAFRWLAMYKELGRKELSKRFRQLDEEYQLALFGPYIRLFDLEAYEDLPEEHQDRLNKMPCGELFYETTTEDPQIFEMLDEIIEANIENNMEYAYSLLAHAAYMPPNEQEANLSQFRKARLEEDGFVTYEESLSIFRPINLQQIRKDSKLAEFTDALATRTDTGEASFLTAVLTSGAQSWTVEEYENVKRGFAFLTNSLCAVSRVEPDDTPGMRNVLRQVNALAGLGLEYLAGRNLELGLSLVKSTHPQILFRAGMTLTGRLQEKMAILFVSAKLPEADYIAKMLRLDKRGEILRIMDIKYLSILGFVRTEVIKGLFNRYPVCPRGATESKAGAGRILFSPIESLEVLFQFSKVLDGIAALIHFAGLASNKIDNDVEKIIYTGFANVLIGGAFEATPLSDEQIETLVHRENSAVQTIAADFFGATEEKLRNDLMDTSGQSWTISRNAGIDAVDPIQNAMNALTDSVMKFHVQRDIASKDGIAFIKSILLSK